MSMMSTLSEYSVAKKFSAPENRTCSGACRRSRAALFQLDLCARLFKLLLQFLRVIFGHRFLDILGRAVDKILRFLESETRCGPHDLDDVDLLRPRALQHDGKLGLCFNSRRLRAAGSRCSPANHHGRG